MQQREKRLAQLRQREIERRNSSVNGIVVEETPGGRIGNIWKGRKGCDPSPNPIPNPIPNPSPNPNPTGLLEAVRQAGKKRTAIEGLDQLDADDIDLLPTNLQFDFDIFNTFCTRMDRLFTEIHGYGLLQSDIKKDWDIIKTQVKNVARARIKIKDQR